MIQRLKLQKEIPENGLAYFAGTFTADDSENEVLNVEELVPPEPISTYLYEVDDHFHLEPLREMLRTKRLWGLSPWIPRRLASAYLKVNLRIDRRYYVGDSWEVWEGRVKPKTLRAGTRHGSHILFPSGSQSMQQKSFWKTTRSPRWQSEDQAQRNRIF